MALRAVPEHPKFAHLKGLLHLPKAVVLGYLECIWHFTAKFTPQGNIGKFTDAAIEAWTEWDGEPGALIRAMTDSRWLEPDAQHRLLVHDWADNADNSTKTVLRNKKLPMFASSSNVPQTRLSPDMKSVVLDQTHLSPHTKNVDLLKHTSPPETGPETGAGAETGSGPGAPPPPITREGLQVIREVLSDGDTWFEEVYSRHPKKKDRGLAMNYFFEITVDRPEFDRVHKLWCIEWAKEKANFAPTLAQWILDKGWRYPPDGPAQQRFTDPPLSQYVD